MNSELNIPVEFIIKDKKKIINGKVIRAALFARSKVLQIQTMEMENYYLVFFNQFLVYGEKLDLIKEGTFIDKVFCEGVILDANHPLLSKIIPTHTVSIPNQNKVLSQLETHFTPQEIAYIATTIDSFFEKEQIIKTIDHIYFQLRRNGKFNKAFQVLQMMKNFPPLLQTAEERLSSLDFHAYHPLYDTANLPSLLEKDPLYLELYCFKNRSNPGMSKLLEDLLSRKMRYMELIMLWLEKVKLQAGVDEVKKYTQFALNIVTLKEWILILSHLKMNPFNEFPESMQVVQEWLEEKKYEEASLVLMNFMNELPDSYDSILTTLWDNVNAKFIVTHLDEFISMLNRYGHDENQKQSETQIYQLIVNLIKEYDLKTVYNKLLPLQTVLPHSLVMRKLSKMAKLMEDPNKMMELGDYYAELNQQDQAIECYSWEMELKPQDPNPVLKISKMYQQKGMAKEASDYQKVYMQLKNLS